MLRRGNGRGRTIDGRALSIMPCSDTRGMPPPPTQLPHRTACFNFDVHIINKHSNNCNNGSNISKTNSVPRAPGHLISTAGGGGGNQQAPQAGAILSGPSKGLRDTQFKARVMAAYHYS